jgi:predicted nucleic acid-binding protein
LIVLDASLMVEWLLGAERKTVARDAYERLRSESIVVPSHWPVELANALRSHLRSAKLSVSKMHALIDQFDLLQIDVEPSITLDEIGPLAHFAATHALTAYDAAYVQLAFHRRAILATLDGAMRDVAHHLNIPVLPVRA